MIKGQLQLGSKANAGQFQDSSSRRQGWLANSEQSVQASGFSHSSDQA